MFTLPGVKLMGEMQIISTNPLLGPGSFCHPVPQMMMEDL